MKRPRIWEPHPLRLVEHIRASSDLRVARPRFHPHRHDFYELGVVLGGECTWRIGRRRLKLRRGDSILVKSSSPHFESVPTGMACELAWLGIDFHGRAPAWAEQVVPLGPDFAEIAAAFNAIARERAGNDELTSARVRLNLQNIFLLVTRQAEKRAPRRPAETSRLNARQRQSIEAAAAYFRRNLRDPASVAQVSAIHSFSPAYFSTLFRSHYRVPPRSYLLQARLDRVRELLATTSLTLKEIADRCGFVDATHLSKAFKRAHRVPPGAFRRNAARAGLTRWVNP